MQSKLTLMLAISLIAIVGLTAWTASGDRPPQPAAQPASVASAEPGRATVSGEAEVRVVPDEVILTLGVETWDKELRLAKQQNDERIRRVLALARGYGIEPRHMQTDHLSIEPRYQDNYDKTQLIGYFVRRTIVITLKDISKFDDLLTDMVAADVNYVHGVQFRTTELRKYRDQARALAIKAAREKAVALAGELGQTVGRPLTIQEDQVDWWSWYNSWWGYGYYSRGGGMSQNVIQEAGPAGPVEEGIAPGQITVKARVTVSFELAQ